MQHAEDGGNEERLIYMDLDLDPVQQADGVQGFNVPIPNHAVIFDGPGLRDTTMQEIPVTPWNRDIREQPVPVGGSSTLGTSREPTFGGQRDKHASRKDMDPGTLIIGASNADVTMSALQPGFPELTLEFPLPRDVIALLVSYDLAQADLLERPGFSLPSRTDFIKQSIASEAMPSTTRACTTCSMPLLAPTIQNHVSSPITTPSATRDSLNATPSISSHKTNATARMSRFQSGVTFVQSASSPAGPPALSGSSTEHPDRNMGEEKSAHSTIDNNSSAPASILPGPCPITEDAAPAHITTETALSLAACSRSASPPSDRAGIKDLSMQPIPPQASVKPYDADTRERQRMCRATHAEDDARQNPSVRSFVAETSSTLENTPKAPSYTRSADRSKEVTKQHEQAKTLDAKVVLSIAVSACQPDQSKGSAYARNGSKLFSNGSSAQTRSTYQSPSSPAGLPIPPPHPAKNVHRNFHPLPPKPSGSFIEPNRGSSTPLTTSFPQSVNSKPSTLSCSSNEDPIASHKSNQPKNTIDAPRLHLPLSLPAAPNGPITNAEVMAVGRKRSRPSTPTTDININSKSGTIVAERPEKKLKKGPVGSEPQVQKEEPKITDRSDVLDHPVEPRGAQVAASHTQVNGISNSPNIEPPTRIAPTPGLRGSPLSQSHTIASNRQLGQLECDGVTHISPPPDPSHNRPSSGGASSNLDRNVRESSQPNPPSELSKACPSQPTPTGSIPRSFRSRNAAPESTPPGSRTSAHLPDLHSVRGPTNGDKQQRGRPVERHSRQNDHYSPSLDGVNSYRPSRSPAHMPQRDSEAYKRQSNRERAPSRSPRNDRRRTSEGFQTSSVDHKNPQDSRCDATNHSPYIHDPPRGRRPSTLSPRNSHRGQSLLPPHGSHNQSTRHDASSYRDRFYYDSERTKLRSHSSNRREGMNSHLARNDIPIHRDETHDSPHWEHRPSPRSFTPRGVERAVSLHSSPQNAAKQEDRARQDKSSARSVTVNLKSGTLSSQAEVGAPTVGDSNCQQLPLSSRGGEGTVDRTNLGPEIHESVPDSLCGNTPSSVPRPGPFTVQQGSDGQDNSVSKTSHNEHRMSHPGLMSELSPTASRPLHSQFVDDAAPSDNDRKNRAFPTQLGLANPRVDANEDTQTSPQVSGASVPNAYDFAAANFEQHLPLSGERHTSEAVGIPHAEEQSHTATRHQLNSPLLSRSHVRGSETGGDSPIGVRIVEGSHEASDSFNPPGLELRHMLATQAPISPPSPPRNAGAPADHSSLAATAAYPPRPSHGTSGPHQDAQAQSPIMEKRTPHKDNNSNIRTLNLSESVITLGVTKMEVSCSPPSLVGRVPERQTTDSDTMGTARLISPAPVSPEPSSVDSMQMSYPTPPIEHVAPHLRDAPPSNTSVTSVSLLERLGPQLGSLDSPSLPEHSLSLLERIGPPLHAERMGSHHVHHPYGLENAEEVEGMDEIEDISPYDNFFMS